jgi:DNA-binding MarR family transcriptional regulator
MNNTKVFYYCARLVDLGNKLIQERLQALGAEGLVPSHGDILMKLFHQGEGSTMGEIASAIHRTRPTVTVLISKLNAKGYVKLVPDTADGRQMRVYLTDKGQALKPSFDEISTALYKLIHTKLNDEELAFLEHLLKKTLE